MMRTLSRLPAAAGHPASVGCHHGELGQRLLERLCISRGACRHSQQKRAMACSSDARAEMSVAPCRSCRGCQPLRHR